MTPVVAPSSTEIAMLESERRKFGIADAMILMVGVAVALAWIRYCETVMPLSQRNPKRGTLLAQGIRLSQYYDVFALLPVMVAMIVIGLRSPERGQILTRPGMMALMAGLVGALATCYSRVVDIQYLIMIGAFTGYTRLTFEGTFLPWHAWMHPSLMGHSIALIWIYMRLSGRWEPRKDWLDRAGRAIGIYWIAMATVPAV